MVQPRLLLTRPRAGAEAFLARLSPALREAALISPVIEIEGTGSSPDLAPYAGVIFSSANAVGHAPRGNGRPAYCVGPQTTEAAQAARWEAQMVGLDAAELIAKLSGRAELGPLVHLAGRHRRGDLAGALSASGLSCGVVTLYEQRLLPLSEAAQALLAGDAPVLVPLFSPRSAQQFAQDARRTDRVIALSISAATAAALDGLSLSAHEIVAEPTGEAMAEAVEKLFHRTTLP